jgi:hypothetical protein
MDVEPPVGDDLNRMLVSMKQEVLQRAAAEPPAKPRPWARRHLGLTLGLVALLGIGGASGALALVLPSPFEAAAPASPTSTPEPSATPRATATPTFTPTAPEQDPVPRPAYDVDCATLGDQIGVGQLVERAGAVDLGPSYFAPEDAAYRQAGVQLCNWRPDGDPFSEPTLSVAVSPAGERGREWISGLRQSGLADLGAGDVSAVVCPQDSSGCNSSVVVGPWWVEVSHYAEPDPVTFESTVTPDVIRPLVQALAEQLSTATPPTSWRAPSPAWQLGGCADLPDPAVVSDAIGGGVSYGPPVDAAEDRPETGILTTQVESPECRWSSTSERLSSDFTFDSVSVSWVTGGAWAVGTATLPGTAVEVAGADSAVAQCVSLEGSACWVDVAVGDSWLRVTTGVPLPDDETPRRLIPVAEAIIAAGTRG